MSRRITLPVAEAAAETRPPESAACMSLHWVRAYGAWRVWAWGHGAWWPASVGGEICVLPQQAAELGWVWERAVDEPTKG